MRFPRVLFTTRRIMALVLIAAVLLGISRWGYLRYAGVIVAKFYYVGDFIRSKDDWRRPVSLAELSEQAEVIKASVTPEVWSLGRASIKPVPQSMSLLIRHTENGHDQIVTYLRQRRDRLYGVAATSK